MSGHCIFIDDEAREDRNGGSSSSSAVDTVKAFRLNTMSFWLTYPQCDTAPAEVLDLVLNTFETTLHKTVDMAIVSRELHKDGHNHIHVALQLTRACHLRGRSGMDRLDGLVEPPAHGNYQAARNFPDVVIYCAKDGNYVSYPEEWNVDAWIEAKRRKKHPKSFIMATMVREGRDMKELEDYDAGFFMMHKRQIFDYAEYTQRNKARRIERSWSFVDTMELNLGTQCLSVALWLNNNVMTDRAFKQEQLYIHGPANVGKTTLVLELESFCRVYHFGYETYHDDFDDDFDLLFLDEYASQLTISFVNKLLEGAPMPIPRKGLPAFQKRKRTPVIMAANKPITEQYPNMDDLTRAAFAGRMQVICLSTLDSLWPLIGVLKEQITSSQLSLN